MKRKLTATNLIGPGVAPVDRAYLEVAPAYPFDDGTATNWDVPVRINLVDGAIPAVDQPLLEDTNDLGEPMTWNIRVVFEDARAKFIGGSRQVAFQLPDGTGDVDYTELIPAEIVEPPEYGPTYLYQTLAARDETIQLKNDTETAAASISKGTPNGVAGLDGAAKVPESQIPTRLSAESLSGTFVTQDVEVLPLAKFLAPGQAMPNNGVPGQTAATTLLQAAIDAANALYVVDGKTRVIEVPSGVFAVANRLTIPPGGGFGIRGQGIGVTVFLPPSGNSFLGSDRPDGPWAHPDFYYSDMLFENFTVDGSRQPSTGTYSSGLKGFIMHHFNRTTFRRVEVKNTHATGFGCDDWTDSWWIECVADNCGKARYTDYPLPEQRFGSGSGFGLGFGQVAFESGGVINCTARNNACGGIFLEHLGREETPFESAGFRAIGNLLDGNNVGILDAGVKGALLQGNTIKGSTYAGLYVGRSFASEQGGVDGIASGNLFYQNANGVIFAGNALGGYNLTDNTILENTNAGIWFPDVLSAFIGQGIKISGNRIRRNGSCGILSENTRAIADLEISGNFILNNGTDATKARREGIAILGPVSRPRIFRNRFSGNASFALALYGSSVVSYSPRIEDNDMEGSRGGTFAVEQSIADKTRIARNIENAAATVTNEVGRPVPNPDLTGWQGSGTTRTREASLGPIINGVTYDAVKGVATSSSPRIAGPTVAVNPGDMVMLSIYAKADISKNIQPAAVFGSTYVTGPIRQGTGAWDRIHMLVSVPAGATSVRSAVVGASGDNPFVAGEVIWASCACITFGSDLWQYIDGAQPGCVWTGAAYGTRSTYTIPVFTAAPTVGGSDDFNRADGAVGSTPIGNHLWVGSGNSSPIYPLVIAGGQAKYGTGGTASRSFWVWDALTADGTLTAIIGDLGDSSHELVIRGLDQANYISLDARIDGTTKTYRISKRIATTKTTVASTPGVVSAAGDVIQITRSGTSITVSVNGAVLFGGAQTVTEFATETKVGFILSASSSHLEGWDYISVAP